MQRELVSFSNMLTDEEEQLLDCEFVGVVIGDHCRLGACNSALLFVSRSLVLPNSGGCQ